MDILCKLPNAKYGVKPYDLRRYEKDHYHDKTVYSCMLADPFKESVDPVALTCFGDRFQEVLSLLYVESFDDLDMEQLWDWDDSRSVCIFYKRFDNRRPRLAGCAVRDDAGSQTRVRVGRCVIVECALLTPSDPDNKRADLFKPIIYTPLIRDMSEDSLAYVEDNILFIPYDQVAKTDADREAFMKNACAAPVLYQEARPMAGRGSVVPCLSCGKDARQKCSKCERVWYCSKECQTKSWKTHKAVCNRQ
jgi:MYND finger